MHTQRLLLAIGNWRRNQRTSSGKADNSDERWQRQAYYQAVTREQLLQMQEEEFYTYIGRLWSMLVWGNKKYVVDKLIADNGFLPLKKELAALLYGDEPVDVRWDACLKAVKGLGPASVSELLCYADPTRYIILNRTTLQCLQYLGVEGLPKCNYQFTGKKYAELCAVVQEIAVVLQQHGVLRELDLLEVDYFLWDEVRPEAEKQQPEAASAPVPDLNAVPAKESKSLHSELQQKLVDIGALLGFESRSEVPIAVGAVVDVVWEARIGNMGKAIYVFEVQSKGSIDSLILNLKKAQSNAAVQAVVAVADEAQIDKIRLESRGVIDEKSLRTWDSADVLVVYDALVRAHESINQLALVPKSF